METCVIDGSGDVFLLLDSFDQDLFKIDREESNSKEASIAQTKGDGETVPMVGHCDENRTDDSQAAVQLPVTMKVSSAVLTAASPVFSAMLCNKLMGESIALSRDGHVDISLADDNPQAFLIVMNIIHGNNAALPHDINLSMLLQIATLVDKYAFHKAVHVHAQTWAKLLKDTIPTSLTDNFLPWLWISWVFGLQAEFKSLTAMAQKESTGSVDDINPFNIPITSYIIDGIESRRQQSIGEVHSFLVAQMDLVKPERCSQKWDRTWPLDAFKFGMIQHLGRMLGLFDDEGGSERRFDGISFKHLSAQVKAINWIDEWCLCIAPPEEQLPVLISDISTFIPIFGVAVHSPERRIWGSMKAQESLMKHIELLEEKEWGMDLER